MDMESLTVIYLLPIPINLKNEFLMGDMFGFFDNKKKHIDTYFNIYCNYQILSLTKLVRQHNNQNLLNESTIAR